MMMMMMKAGGRSRGSAVLLLLVACARAAQGVLVPGEQVALVRVTVEHEPGSSVLQGRVLLQGQQQQQHKQQHQSEEEHELQGDLRLVKEEREGVRSAAGHIASEGEDEGQRSKPWIGVVPVQVEEGRDPNTNQESFASTVVNKMKRALVLGASALIILVLNQNTLREMDVSQLLSKPIIIIQNSENVTKLFGALLRGLHATARITYKTFLQNNLGATLTLWSSCGRSRWGRYGEWQGVVCTGETNSPVQKYLQQLWNTVVLIALILSTGVLVHARRQNHHEPLTDQLQLHPKQELLSKLSVLKTRKYRRKKHTEAPDTENCAVCLEQYTTNQCLRVLPCLHEFHRDCVDPWLLLQQTCPLCKRCVLGNFC
ncbi:RING finger protein 215 [Clarias gariepinus]|uniref:RING finger protein 215 n=1 Tax=Clarias gariepinus TaxID=13013 RepID=UPI00234D1BF3|nr:RING finger protein 215 [Clarias gariepinus]